MFQPLNAGCVCMLWPSVRGEMDRPCAIIGCMIRYHSLLSGNSSHQHSLCVRERREETSLSFGSPLLLIPARVINGLALKNQLLNRDWRAVRKDQNAVSFDVRGSCEPS